MSIGRLCPQLPVQIWRAVKRGADQGVRTLEELPGFLAYRLEVGTDHELSMLEPFSNERTHSLEKVTAIFGHRITNSEGGNSIPAPALDGSAKAAWMF